jgi:hypothetical protein
MARKERGDRWWAVALAVMAMVPQRSFAGAPQAPVADGGPRTSRVRCLDPEATRVFKGALATSPTVTRMVERLQDTDLIVGIEAAPLEKVTRGQVRIVTAVAGVRYLRIRLTTPLPPNIATSVLGHELQHALEIAAMPEVRDDVSLAVAYQRIGFATRAGGYFETEAALATGERVADEAAGMTGGGVRALHQRGHVLLAKGSAVSTTFKRLVDEIAQSDVVVYVDLDPHDPRTLDGVLQFVGCGGNVRYVKVWLRPRRTDDEIIVRLGHELEHAVEVARAPQIVSQASLVAFYQAAGQSDNEGRFETRAAQEVAAKVRREMVSVR